MLTPYQKKNKLTRNIYPKAISSQKNFTFESENTTNQKKLLTRTPQLQPKTSTKHHKKLNLPN